MHKICGIYKISNAINGKSYIGQSIDILKRWEIHLRAYGKKDTLIKNAICKYGILGLSFEILEECTKNLLDTREIYWIEKLNTISPFGYNLTSGGKSTTYSKESKTNLSKMRMGRIISESTKKKIAISLLGSKKSLESRIAQARSNMNGDTISCSNGKEYLSKLECFLDTKISGRTIDHCISNPNRSSMGLYFVRNLK